MFDKKADFFAKPLPKEIEKRLQRIVSAVPLSASSRVLDFGSGTGCLIPHMQAAGARDILAVDASSNMLAKSRERYGGASTLGNEPAVRFWHGDMATLPNHMGGADAIFINAVFGNVVDEHAVLLKCVFLLKDGGHVVISHPLGREWLKGLHEQDPQMVPHELPDRAALEHMIADLPLHIVDFVDEKDMYLATLQVPPGYQLRDGPLHMQGEVVTGFQRGSAEMGMPTANVASTQVEHHFEGRPKGVYFGWAQLQRGDAGGERAVAPMVLNYGVRPTAKNGSHATIEAHILRKYDEDFYGADLKLLVVGFLRPEMPFPGFQALLDQINADIGQAKTQLGKLSAEDTANAGWWT